MSMINDILKIKQDNSVLWQYGKSKKQVLQEIVNAFDGLVVARTYLLDKIDFEALLGIQKQYKVKNAQVGLSLLQMRHYIRYVAKTGKTLKRPYKVINTELPYFAVY